MKKALVFGGNVFVGKAIAEKLLKMGYTVYVLNRGNRTNPEGTIHLKADRNCLEDVLNLCKGINFDVVVDSSAYTPKQTKIAIQAINHNIKHYIHISSASVYIDENIYPYTENSKRGTCPIWGDYSTNKYLCEELLFKECKENGFPVTILRPFYIYGPENNLDRESYVIKRLLTGNQIIVPGRGLPLIQFGYIDDLCYVIELICKNNICCGRAYNISGKEYISLKGWVEICAKVLNVEPKIVLVDTSSTGFKAREWFPFRDVTMIGNCERIKQDIGFEPQYTFEEGMKKIIESIDLNQFTDGFEISDIEKSILIKLSKY
ncbi:SDR family oxidoreductase [Acetivibrio mesophilus]|uniref:SDR family oxidoreductase n=1 Tax=Acetivibrio mesophilus TaxID=2487273 RepID=A0A4Q0I7G2_9FIRM|nr:SDR family oxidoreductase [Acetivibrio mesophilus]RXE60341.1 SDR family oxidoreductase [Acetivibrio mesophilus]